MTPTVLNIPHGTQRYPPIVLMISLIVLNTPHGTQDISHIYHDIPHSTNHPSWHSRYPTTVLVSSPTVLNTHFTGCQYNLDTIQWLSSTRGPPKAVCPPWRLPPEIWSKNNRTISITIKIRLTIDFAPPPEKIPGRKPELGSLKMFSTQI